MSDAIKVITLSRGEAAEDGPWVAGGGHRVYAPWPEAEREVKARCLRSLADRQTPPDGVAFMRQWEEPAKPLTPEQMNHIGAEVHADYQDAVARVAADAAILDAPRRKGRRGR